MTNTPTIYEPPVAMSHSGGWSMRSTHGLSAILFCAQCSPPTLGRARSISSCLLRSILAAHRAITRCGAIHGYVCAIIHFRLAQRHATLGLGIICSASLDEAGFPEEVVPAMREYFERAATFMINQAEDHVPKWFNCAANRRKRTKEQKSKRASV